MDGVHIGKRAGDANSNVTLAVYAAHIRQADVAVKVDAWLRER